MISSSVLDLGHKIIVSALVLTTIVSLAEVSGKGYTSLRRSYGVMQQQKAEEAAREAAAKAGEGFVTESTSQPR
ncbi:hypothetical protein CAOG_03209 [Capsaspora owczarzaki ATCC 30864]|uniref:Uncharacterized protein n=1 Tax=Capsaspora owczarzaki (strain ATCC 30864) TaxID=595528 RepID=A0A0D2VP65_CAPO3|nr:hypothetical protein CAOG_03209 [Capsaspora owczarzaki ATCC 30864]KJE92197.1 hypothetical protein CAOG_003209 [Capsaspora owczarzaki ATCC 30864]|eukprot:XP_004364048.1 hypothetical protein CAOG_03209 [Capsaspora owczarzaki ATCC 30864]